MKIAIIPNLQKENALSCTYLVCEMLQKQGVQVMISSEYSEELPQAMAEFYADFNRMIQLCDVIVTIGGDGTILHAAKHAVEYDKPLLGINCGRLGFLAELEVNEIERIKQLLSGEYKIEMRMLLDVVVHQKEHEMRAYALNDVVVSKGLQPQMVDICLGYNGCHFYDYRADGLIFSTPTGSTAYSLSAGGPVIDPQTNCILMTPISSHSLFSRPIIFGGEGKLTVFPSACQKESVRISVDGDQIFWMEQGDRVEICKSQKSLKLLRLKARPFYEVLTSKFSENK